MSRYDNLMNLAEATGAIKRVEEPKEALPVALVAPLGVSVPDDGILSYVTVDNFKQLLDTPEGSVVLFREDQAQMLTTFCRDSDLFGRSVQVLYGAPGSTYDRWFDEATFEKSKVSYAPLVSEIRIAGDIAAVKKANESQSVVDKEEQQFRKRDGGVRYDERIGTAAEVFENDDSEIDR